MTDSGVTYDAKELNKWFNDPSRRPRVVKAFEDVGIDGENRLKLVAKDISASGKNYNSITSKVKESASNLSVRIVANAMYSAAALETGRAPGKPPHSKMLERWVRSKGLGLMSVATSGRSRASLGSSKKFASVVSSTEKTIAYLIARKIGKEGTKKYKNGKPKLISETYEYIMANIVPKRMGEILDSYIK